MHNLNYKLNLLEWHFFLLIEVLSSDGCNPKKKKEHSGELRVNFKDCHWEEKVLLAFKTT